VDDGAFDREDRYAPIAAVALSLPEHVEAVRTGRVRVDGTDGTRRVMALVRSLGPIEGVRAVLLDGAVVGGFNVLDLSRLRRELGVPIVAVTRRPPEFARIRAALRKWFPRTAAQRWALLRAHRLFPVPTGGQPILAAAAGCTRADAVRLVQRSTVHGFWPEPLRLAHLVASAAYPPSRPARRIKEGGDRRARGPVA
jgi:uncharacterized protein